LLAISFQETTRYCGILQADAYAGFNMLYEPDRKPGPITEAGCWAHARRKLFELADIASKARKQEPSSAPMNTIGMLMAAFSIR
jgi:hypothetical protein